MGGHTTCTDEKSKKRTREDFYPCVWGVAPRLYSEPWRAGSALSYCLRIGRLVDLDIVKNDIHETCRPRSRRAVLDPIGDFQRFKRDGRSRAVREGVGNSF